MLFLSANRALPEIEDRPGERVFHVQPVSRELFKKLDGNIPGSNKYQVAFYGCGCAFEWDPSEEYDKEDGEESEPVKSSRSLSRTDAIKVS